MWTTAFVAAGLQWPGPAALVLLKPTLLAVRADRTSTSIRGGLSSRLIAVLTVLGPWRDYLTVVAQQRTTGRLLYSLGTCR